MFFHFLNKQTCLCNLGLLKTLGKNWLIVFDISTNKMDKTAPSSYLRFYKIFDRRYYEKVGFLHNNGKNNVTCLVFNYVLVNRSLPRPILYEIYIIRAKSM